MHLGYRSPLEIRALFQGCMSLVFPSLFEGYGMPVAEAIIAGKTGPLLERHIASLRSRAMLRETFDPHGVEKRSPIRWGVEVGQRTLTCGLPASASRSAAPQEPVTLRAEVL